MESVETVKKTILILLFLQIVSGLIAQEIDDKLEGGLKFNSYETSKDSRTGISFTPNESISIKNSFQIDFEFGYWRPNQSYGYIFRFVSGNGINIDLISNPYSLELDDISLVIKNDQTSISYNFDEIDMIVGKWYTCTFKYSNESNTITFSINSKEKSVIISDKIDDDGLALFADV